MNLYEKLDDIQRLVRKVATWSNEAFDWEKAYVASLFASLAYEEIPEFELKTSERAKVIPCDSYQAHVSRWESDQTRSTLAGIDSQIPRGVVVREQVVVTAFQLPEVIFVAFRGTTISFADFKADLDVRKARYPLGFGESVKFHRGFFEAVLEAFDEVVERIDTYRQPKDLPIYVCGHSLGGAMAAIFHGQANEDKHHLSGGRRHRSSPRTEACYTFGMPRYGDLSAKALLAQPYHTYNELDAVPTLPPKLLGYVDSANERCVNAIPAVLPSIHKGDFAFRTQDGMSTILGVSDHRMERYIDRVRILAKK